MTKYFALVLLMLCGILYAAANSKSIIHVKQINPTDVGITCSNGGDPTGIMRGDVLIISCGTEAQ